MIIFSEDFFNWIWNSSAISIYSWLILFLFMQNLIKDMSHIISPVLLFLKHLLNHFYILKLIKIVSSPASLNFNGFFSYVSEVV